MKVSELKVGDKVQFKVPSTYENPGVTKVGKVVGTLRDGITWVVVHSRGYEYEIRPQDVNLVS